MKMAGTCWAWILLPPLLLSGCSAKTGDEISSHRTKPFVTVVKAELLQLAPSLESYGHAAPRRVTEVIAPVEGITAELSVEVGDMVTRGQKIARLENLQLQLQLEAARQEVASAESALQLAQSELQEGERNCEIRLITIDKLRIELTQQQQEAARMEQQRKRNYALLEMDGISRSKYDEAVLMRDRARAACRSLQKEIEIAQVGYRDRDLRHAGMQIPDSVEERRKLLQKLNTLTLQARKEAAEANLERAHSQLAAAELLCKKLNILAPAAGMISRRPVECGELVGKHKPIATILDIDHITVISALPEEETIRIKHGMPAVVRFDCLGTGDFQGKITSIAPAVQTDSGNITVEIGIRNPRRLIRPGMFARISIPYGTQQQLVRLPASAVLRREGDTAVVCLLRDGRVLHHTVPVQNEGGNNVHIAEGISPGTLAVDNPSPFLREGQEVRYE